MFIVLLKKSDLGALASHRHRDGWEIALSSDDACFLKVQPGSRNEELLAHLPCLKRWTLDEKERLIPLGKSLPEIILPHLDWFPLATLLPLTSTKVRQNEPFFGHLGLALIPATQPQPPAALRLPFQKFAAWADTAPAPRLAPLTFALSDSGDALVIGQPLPPLPGQTFYRDGQILIPCGRALPDFILAKNLATQRSQLLLIELDNTVHHIESELCLPATRGTIRTTASSL